MDQAQGGYFISLDILPGCTKRVIELAKDAGVALTKAVAPFPRGRDSNHSNIGIAPNFAMLEQINAAAEAITLRVLLETSEALFKKISQKIR